MASKQIKQVANEGQVWVNCNQKKESTAPNSKLEGIKFSERNSLVAGKMDSEVLYECGTLTELEKVVLAGEGGLINVSTLMSGEEWNRMMRCGTKVRR